VPWDGWMENINTIQQSTEALTVARKELGLRINGEKATYK
jgi:hypothetical protein